MSPFDEDLIVNRLFDKLDDIGTKIDDLCTRMTKQETKYDLHIESGQQRAERKEKRFYVIMAVFGGIVSLIEVVRSYING